MNQTLINRYQPGGDLFGKIEAQYGYAAAQKVAAAARTGNSRNVTDVIVMLRHGSALPESTTLILAKTLVTDPLGAPLDAANQAITTLGKNTLFAFFRNPTVVGVLILLGFAAFVWFFGPPRFLSRLVPGR